MAKGGTPAQRFSHLSNRLAWCMLSTEEFLIWRHATPAERRRRRPEIWLRFTTQRDDPLTRPALLDRLQVVVDRDELGVLTDEGLSLLSWPRLCAWLPPRHRPSPLALGGTSAATAAQSRQRHCRGWGGS
jgi:hypothetical protein